MWARTSERKGGVASKGDKERRKVKTTINGTRGLTRLARTTASGGNNAEISEPSVTVTSSLRASSKAIYAIYTSLTEHERQGIAASELAQQQLKAACHTRLGDPFRLYKQASASSETAHRHHVVHRHQSPAISYDPTAQL